MRESLIGSRDRKKALTGLIVLLALGASGAGLLFYRGQNASPSLGGAIAASKAVWLLTAITLWFFICPLVAWSGTLTATVQASIRLFSIGMWCRGLIEIYLLYGPKTWSPIMGISHDLLSVFLLLVFALRRPPAKSLSAQSSEDASMASWGFLLIVVLSLLIEAHHAALFLEVVREGTQGNHAIWFAEESNPAFHVILHRTRIGNTAILGAFSLWLAFWNFPVFLQRFNSRTSPS